MVLLLAREAVAWAEPPSHRNGAGGIRTPVPYGVMLAVYECSPFNVWTDWYLKQKENLFSASCGSDKYSFTLAGSCSPTSRYLILCLDHY